MPFTEEQAAAQVQDRLISIASTVHDYETQRLKTEQQVETIQKAHDKINQEGRITPYNQQKLMSLYMAGINDAAAEEETLRNMLTKIREIREICNERRLQVRSVGNRESFHRGAMMLMLQTSAQTLPLYVGKPNTKPPPLCGAIPPDPNYIAKPGDMVAAFVKKTESPTQEDNWMLAEVVLYNVLTKKYEVDDIDEEQQKCRFVLSRSRIVPLPLMRANPETDPDALFPPGTLVMALYPTTTCFYKAIVNQPPLSCLDDYEVVFEDNSCANGYSIPYNVAQRYVIEIKDLRKS
uniref:SAGA-associated factor 29 n=1 Tax=Lygus hesperus TaxID=30085 RepID=A0A0A9Z4V7_LYGHE